LRSIISDGIAYFVAWRELMVEDDESAHALNRYRGLFLPARGALDLATDIAVDSITDYQMSQLNRLKE